MCLLQDCARPLSIEADENGCFPLDGKILCMKCHTQRAKQAAHWPRYDTHPVQKHRIHSATGFLPLQQQLCSVEICRRECERAEKKCLHAGKVSPTPVPPPLVFVCFSAEVMYCTEGPKKKKKKVTVIPNPPTSAFFVNDSVYIFVKTMFTPKLPAKLAQEQFDGEKEQKQKK